jgi:murein DD-endopeptidase MepM/ murein hydrolase activator NlpD
MTGAGLVLSSSRWIDVLAQNSLLAVFVFAAVIAANSFLRRRGPAIRLVLWGLVFVRLLLPPSLTHPVSAGALAERLTAAGRVTAGVRDNPLWSVISGATGSDETNLESLSAGRARLWKAALALLWFVGALSVITVNERRLAAFRRVVRSAREVRDPAVLKLAATWRSRLRVRRPVTVVSSAAAVPPLTLGTVRPVIFIPAAVVADPGLVEPVLAHEMTHVAHWDALWLRLQRFIEALYFFHPLVWISGAEMEKEREWLCDATVVAGGRLAAHEYVRGLLNVLQLDLQGAGVPTMTARKRRIGMRIRSALDSDGARRPRPALAALAAGIVGVFLLPLGSGGADAAAVDVEAREQQQGSAAASKAAIDLVNPLPIGRVTWTWGPGHVDPFTNKEVFHSGIDVAADAGTPVVAPASGLVTVATDDFEQSPSSGSVVVLDHGDGYTTLFSHLGSLEVSEGQRVAQGDVIATVGSTGKSTGPHLHFEVRHDGESLNPADFVSGWK